MMTAGRSGRSAIDHSTRSNPDIQLTGGARTSFVCGPSPTQTLPERGV